MTDVDIFILIAGIIGWSTAIAITRQCYRWRKKYEVLKATHYTEIEMKDDTITQLKDKLSFYEDNERVIKIEQVHAEPREYTCKFFVHERFIDDTETFKKICISELSRYMAEELEKDSMAYKVFFEKDAWTESNAIKIKFRLLPYLEDMMSFEEIMDEVKKK